MSNTNEMAKVNPLRKISFAWIIPLLALIITAIMLWDNTLNRGPEVELIVPSADGIEAGKTLVKFRSVNVGRVETVEIEDDLKSVRLGIRMNPNTDNLLLEDSKFWIVKPRIDTNSISGLDTLLGGSYVQIALGTSDKRADRFIAEEHQPVNPYNEDGVTVTLKSNGKESIPEGTVVEYKGVEVGNVATSKLDPHTDTFEYQLFIRKPYDVLLKGNVFFWNDAGIDLKIDGSGLNLSTKSLLSLLQGTITFEGFGYRDADKMLDLSKTYQLYENRDAAENEMLKSYPNFLVNLGHDAGALEAGSDIYYRGIPAGKVIEVPWRIEDVDVIAPDDDIYALVSLYTYSEENEEVSMKFFIDNLDKNKVCINTYSASIFSGENALNIEIGDHVKCKAKEKVFDGIRVIPMQSEISGTPQRLMGDILAELKGMKLDKTSSELRKTMVELQKTLHHMSNTLDSVNQQQLVKELTKTVKQFEKTMAGFDAQGKIYKDMSQLVIQLNQALKDLKPAVKDVGQKPNSIIFSDTTGDPVPGRR